MKPAFFTLCAVVLLVSASAFTQSDANSPTSSLGNSSNPVHQSLNFGLYSLLNFVYGSGKVSNTTQYTLSNVNSIQQEVIAGGNYNYTFSVTCTGSDGSVLIGNYSVYYVPATEYMMVLSMGYSISGIPVPPTPPVPPSPWTYVDPSQLKTDADLKASLDLGVNTIIQEGESAGKIPDDNYNIVDYNSIAMQELSDGKNYKFDVELTNGETVVVNMDFIVNSPNVGNRTLMSWSFNVSGIPVDFLY